MKKVFLGLIVFISVLGIFFWQKNKDSTPKVEIGEEIEDKGRNHVTDIYGVVYSSNPPTSGSHFPVWAKPGLYDRLISDGYFIHSMEHGYVVIWYNCEAKDNTALKWPLNTEVLAHDEPAVLSPDSKIPFMHMNFDLNSKNEAWFPPENSPAIEKELPPIKTFFISGGTELAAMFDIARTISRRAERRVVGVVEEEDRKVGEFTKAYLNRLSSLLYALARKANFRAGVTEEGPDYQ